MSKVNLKGNIWICGFDSEKEIYDITLIVDFDTCIWAGKTSDIPEEVARECVEYVNGVNGIGCRDYLITTMVNHKETAKQSIQSSCDKPYCIIYVI